MTSHGAVREWDDNEGIGVIDSPDTPGGCWAHFSNIVADETRPHVLTAGEQVTFSYEAGSQDGFDYRAVLVWPPGVKPGTPQRATPHRPWAAYRSTLTIRWSDGTVTTRPGER